MICVKSSSGPEHALEDREQPQGASHVQKLRNCRQPQRERCQPPKVQRSRLRDRILISSVLRWVGACKPPRAAVLLAECTRKSG